MTFIKLSNGAYRIVTKVTNGQKNLSVNAVSTAAGANIAQYEYVGGTNDHWFLEKATLLGAAKAYRQENSKEVNCLGYALEINEWPYIVAFPEDTVQTVYDQVESYVKVTLKRQCRKLTGKDDLIHPTLEYKIAMRIQTGVDFPDYHFMVQLSNGKWAQKHGTTASDPKELVDNPTTANWGMGGSDNSNYYDSATIYFAVTR